MSEAGEVDAGHRYPPYSLSGEFGSALWLMPLGGIILCLFLGFAYSYANVHLPSKLFSLLLPPAAGFLTGAANLWLARVSRCRNKHFVMAHAVLIGLLSLYFAWAFFVSELMWQNNIPLSAFFFMRSPLVMCDFAGELLGNVSLAAFWVVEAVLLIGMPLRACLKKFDGASFCENCGEWFEEDLSPVNVPNTQSRECVNRMEGGDLSAISELNSVNINGDGSVLGNPWIEILFHPCKKCGSECCHSNQVFRTYAGATPTDTRTPLTQKFILPPGSKKLLQDALKARRESEIAAAQPTESPTPAPSEAQIQSAT